jgi:hypothetical protein
VVALVEVLAAAQVVALVEVLAAAQVVALLVEAAVALVVEAAVALVVVVPAEAVLLVALLGMRFHIQGGGSIHLEWINFTATSLFRYCVLGEIGGTILRS